MANSVSTWVTNSYGHKSSTFTWVLNDANAQTTEAYPVTLLDDFTVVFNPTGADYDVAATLGWDLEASYDGGTTWVNVIPESGKAIDDVAYRYYFDKLTEGSLPSFRIKATPSEALSTTGDSLLEVIIIR
tara:strand:+ start:1385 stop:1774 length:390 start_codon:yes stop_codon:yes gene_type:complete